MSRGARGRWHWPVRIGVALLSVALALVVLELLLGRRVPEGDGAAFFDKAPDGVEVPYVLRADTEVDFDGHYVKIPPTTVRINAQGLRAEREYAVPKPAGRTRLLMLGDSFVFGSGVEEPETFVRRFEALRGGDLEVINLGVPGYNSTHAVELLAERGLRFSPDGVVLFVSDNDFFAEGSRRLAERQAQGEQWALERYAEGRVEGQRKADSVWRRDPETTLARLLEAVDRLEALGRARGFAVRVFLLFPHELEADILAMGMGITRLTDDAYLKDITSLQIPRDLHPNAAGHARLAQLLLGALDAWPD